MVRQLSKHGKKVRVPSGIPVRDRAVIVRTENSHASGTGVWEVERGDVTHWGVWGWGGGRKFWDYILQHQRELLGKCREKNNH